MSDIAKLGFSVDTRPLKKGEQALDSFASTGEKTEKRTDKASKKIINDYRDVEKTVGKTAASMVKAERDVAKAQKESEKQLRKRSRGLGQAGIQFQQFIGQIQGGQGILLALSQQGADLGIVLDRALLGSIIGISASIAGLLLPQLFKTKDAMQLLEDINKDLGNSLEESAEGVDVLSKSLLKLADKSEALAKLQISASIQDAEKLITTSAEGIEQALDDAFGMTTESVLRGFSANLREAATRTTGSMDDVVEALGKGNNAFIGFTSGAEISDTVRVIASKFKITKEQAVGLGIAISDVFEDQSILNIKKFESTIADLNLSVGGSNKEINKLAKVLIPLFDATTDGVDKVNLLREAFGNFGEKAAEADEDLLKFNENVKGVSTSLEAQIVALRDGEEASVNYAIAQRLSLKDGEAIPAAIKAQIAELKNLRNQQEEDLEFGRIIAAETKEFDAQQKREKADSIRDFDKLTKKVENFGGTWTKTGSVIVDAFGDISDAMNDYMSQLTEIEKNEKSLAKFREQKGDDNLEVIALQQKLESDRISAELSGIKAVSKAGQSLFDEKNSCF